MRLFRFIVFGLLFFSSPVMAQEPVPNDSCAGYPEGAIMRSGGPELGGANYLMRCTSGIWTETTPNPDTTPDPFSFTDQTGVATSTLITSNSVTITGINASTPVSVSGDGSPEIRINGGSWATSGNIENGQTLEVRLTSNAANSTMNSATVDVGGVTDQWDVTTESSDPCAGSPTPGTTCSDGSIYAGLSPDGNVAMYTTPSDGGGIPWNNGNSSGIVNLYTPTTESTTGGEASTAAFIGVDSDSDTGGVQPFQAPEYCYNLDVHGHQDWYVPARDEFFVLYDNQVDIGGFGSTYYWTATEVTVDAMIYVNITDGSTGSGAKHFANEVRCVRKGS